jgi:hypothetical protein
MKLEFTSDRIPGPRGSKTEYFLQKPRYRFVVATNCVTGVTLLAASWIVRFRNRETSLVFLGMGLVLLLSAGFAWRHGIRKSRMSAESRSGADRLDDAAPPAH